MATATAKGPFTGLTDPQKETATGLASNLTGAGGTLAAAGVVLAVFSVLDPPREDSTLSGLGALLKAVLPWLEVLVTVAAGVVAVLAAGSLKFVSAASFEDEARPALTKQASQLNLFAVALVGLGGLSALAGLLGLFLAGVTGLLPLVAGALTAFLGLVLLAASADVGYLASTRGYETAHTANTLDSFTMFFRVLGALTTLVVLVAVVRAWLYFVG